MDDGKSFQTGHLRTQHDAPGTGFDRRELNRRSLPPQSAISQRTGRAKRTRSGSQCMARERQLRQTTAATPSGPQPRPGPSPALPQTDSRPWASVELPDVSTGTPLTRGKSNGRSGRLPRLIEGHGLFADMDSLDGRACCLASLPPATREPPRCPHRPDSAIRQTRFFQQRLRPCCNARKGRSDKLIGQLFGADFSNNSVVARRLGRETGAAFFARETVLVLDFLVGIVGLGSAGYLVMTGEWLVAPYLPEPVA